jgi:phosphoglycolate phosphatase-like HAD superfamily hydrolase
MAHAKVFTKEDLVNFKAQHPTFVGIDSDGCVFDTMEIKQKRCFHGLIVSHWRLEPIEKYVRESAEFVNLYSKWRGQNRFPCLLMSIDLLRDRPEVVKSGVKLPDFTALRKFIASGLPLSNPELEKYAASVKDPELASLLKWSKDVNTEIARVVKNVPPFSWALESLKQIHRNSDAICVSQTPTEALVREWEENDIRAYVSNIAGQELGTKSEHLAFSTKGRYGDGKVLMIGDAPGDLKAARDNAAFFFPINPGQENASWELFAKEGYARFLQGTYTSEYEGALIRKFNALMPDTPPWKKKT